MRRETYLYLEDGTVFKGESFGYYGECFGEVVFSTAMTGYVQSLTDPSFCGQILTFTYPLIGNYGVPSLAHQDTNLMANAESERIQVQGVIVSQYARRGSHYELNLEFSDWLMSERIPGICGIDTRALTLRLREHGVIRGMISPSKTHPDWKSFFIPSIFTTSISEPVTYVPKNQNGKKIIVLDCGVKHGILRTLLLCGYTLIRIPYNANPLDYPLIDGVLCSNGPGDPKEWKESVEIIKNVLEEDIPFTGVCLGNQLLALAIGADTYKLLYGHRGLNQPCQDVQTKRCYLTSQNHGYAVDPTTIPNEYEEWFINLNDRTNEGIRHKTKPIRSTQFHPEGHPGPFDTAFILSLL
jgi:carbamoyl-phosphate synthase small subunit